MSNPFVKIIRSPRGDVTIPESEYLKDDGEPYRFMLRFDQGGQTAFADLCSDLISAFIPGYDTIPPEDTIGFAVQRIAYARRVAWQNRAALLSFASFADTHNRLSDRERTAIDNTETVIIPVWESDLVLTVVDADYKPYTQVPAPKSVPRDSSTPPGANIVTINTADDFGFLATLTEAGHTEFFDSMQGDSDDRD